MRKELKSERNFLRFLEDQLSRRLPPDWSFRLEVQNDRAADTTFTLRSPDGRFGTVAIEFRPAVEPRMVAEIESRADRSHFEALLVGAPFLSPRTRQLLAEANLSYADLTGNVRLATRLPPLFIEAQGKSKNPSREPRPLKSLKGRAVARVVRALCDFRPPYTTGQLAERSGASPATTSRVVSLLDDEALVTREGRGAITDVAWPDLIQRWAQDYSVLKTNMAWSYIEPRGLGSLRQKLAGVSAMYVATGSLAARLPAPIAPARLAMIYSRDAGALAHLLDLRDTETGANTTLLEPFDPVVFQRASERNGMHCAAYSQVAVDLLTSPGRGPAEGEELIRWMRGNEGEWRS